ncbi:MAG: BACON domain-containing carbohydrate-binding protein, partial [Bryobacteraceae bacterium]
MGTVSHAAVWLLILASAAAAQRSPELGPAPIAPDPGKLQESQRVRSAGVVSAAGWIDTSNRALVSSLYASVIEATNLVPMGWTGTLNGCVAGTTTAAYQGAVLQRINWFRGMAGVPAGVSFDEGLGAKDAEAALIMSANRSLNHYPPTDWTCYSAAGYDGASHSNICIWYGSFDDPGCVELYIRDHGVNNEVVGHRRWLLYPQTEVMATGDVFQSSFGGQSHPTGNAIWVIPASNPPRPATRDDFVAWPPKGYVPYQVVPPRWSISYPAANFASATVTMTRAGSSIPVALAPVENGYGENTLVWVANNLNADDFQSNWARPVGDETVHVTVSGATVSGSPRTFEYDVIIFDPTAGASCSYTLVPPSPVSVSASGSAGVGFLVQTTAGCTWTVTSPASWITITGGASGNGSGSVSFNIAANPGPGARSATLTAAGLPYVVNQAAPVLPPPNVTPAITAVTPVSGSGLTRTFTVTASDGNGASDINVINLLINSALDGRNACYLAYSRADNMLYLVPDSGSGLLPGLLLNGSGTLGNSACTISGAGSSAPASGNTVTLTLAITFNQSSFAGNKIVYAAVRDVAAANTGWLTRGT